MLQADLEKDMKRQKIWDEAVEKCSPRGEKFPKEREFYPANLRDRSLSNVLSGQKRMQKPEQVIEKGLTIFPGYLYLRQMFWKTL